MFGTCSFVKTTNCMSFVFQDRLGKPLRGLRMCGKSADTELQVIGCEGKQRSLGWLTDSPCADICGCSTKFSGCLRVELS
jgi:hypothetical protein